MRSRLFAYNFSLLLVHFSQTSIIFRFSTTLERSRSIVRWQE